MLRGKRLKSRSDSKKWPWIRLDTISTNDLFENANFVCPGFEWICLFELKVPVKAKFQGFSSKFLQIELNSCYRIENMKEWFLRSLCTSQPQFYLDNFLGSSDGHKLLRNDYDFHFMTFQGFFLGEQWDHDFEGFQRSLFRNRDNQFWRSCAYRTCLPTFQSDPSSHAITCSWFFLSIPQNENTVSYPMRTDKIIELI